MRNIFELLFLSFEWVLYRTTAVLILVLLASGFYFGANTFAQNFKSINQEFRGTQNPLEQSNPLLDWMKSL